MIPSISPFWGRKCSILCGLFLSGAISSVTQSCPTLCDPMDCSTPGLPVHHQFPKLAQTHVCWVSDANPIFPSIRVFSNKSVLRIRGPKYWSFSFSISPSNEYSGLISHDIPWDSAKLGYTCLICQETAWSCVKIVLNFILVPKIIFEILFYLFLDLNCLGIFPLNFYFIYLF